MIRLKIEEEEKSKEIKAEKERHAAETKGKMKVSQHMGISFSSVLSSSLLLTMPSL